MRSTDYSVTFRIPQWICVTSQRSDVMIWKWHPIKWKYKKKYEKNYLLLSISNLRVHLSWTDQRSEMLSVIKTMCYLGSVLYALMNSLRWRDYLIFTVRLPATNSKFFLNVLECFCTLHCHVSYLETTPFNSAFWASSPSLNKVWKKKQRKDLAIPESCSPNIRDVDKRQWN